MRLSVLPSKLTLWLLAAASPLFLVSAPLALATDAAILLAALLDGRRVRSPAADREAPRLSALAAVTEVAITVQNPMHRKVLVKVTDDLDPCLRRVRWIPGSNGPRGAGAAAAHGWAGATGAVGTGGAARAGSPGSPAGPARRADGWGRGTRIVVPASGSAACAYRVTPRTRGLLALGDIHLRTLSPLGLAWRRSTAPASDVLQVQPGVRDLLRDRSGHAVRRTLRTPGQRRTRQWGEGREFESLRDYARGDDPRTIDWKASARRRRHVVRNYEAERSQNIVLAIDAGRHMRERLSPLRERIDYALGACTMLASRAQKFGDRIGVVVFDEQVRHLSPPRRADPAGLARVLAGVETRLVEPNYPLAFATLGRTFRKRSLVILFCDVIDRSVSRSLVRSLTRIGRAHLPLAIAIRNPALEAASSRPAAGEAEVYHRAAAEELVQARRTTLRTMRQSGILIVDTPPGDALVRTLDKYVEIKERGLL